jgi:hypothetical protein
MVAREDAAIEATKPEEFHLSTIRSASAGPICHLIRGLGSKRLLEEEPRKNRRGPIEMTEDREARLLIK